MKSHARPMLLLLLGILLIQGCQDALNELSELNLADAVGEANISGSASSNENDLPVIRFNITRKGDYRMIIRDDKTDTTQTMNLTVSDPSENVSLNFEQVQVSYRTVVQIPGGANTYEGGVVNIDLTYFDQKGNKTKGLNFDVFVFEDGSTAVQNPKILGSTISILKETDPAIELLLTDDPANMVETVELTVTEVLTGMLPLQNPIRLKKYHKGLGEKDDIVSLRATIQDYFNETPNGFEFKVVGVKKNKDGKEVGEPFHIILTFREADFTGSVRRIRIKQLNESSNFRTALTFEGNDAASFVDYVEIMVKTPDGTQSAIAYPNKSSLEDDEKEGTTYISKALSGVEVDRAYSVTAVFYGFDGEEVGKATRNVLVESYQSTDRIRQIRIRELNSDAVFRIIVDENITDTNEEAAYVQIEFNDTYGNPAPVSGTAILTLTRSDIEKMLNRYVFRPLTFEGGARPLESIYSLTATMLAADGTPVGHPVIKDVIVETNNQGDENPEVKLLGSQIVSYDQGKTWTMIVKLENPEPWVEGLEVEFVGPFEGPEPTQNLIKLTPTSEEPGGVIVYSGNVSFKGDAVGFNYGTLVFQFGTGTRSSAGSTSTKAELL